MKNSLSSDSHKDSRILVPGEYLAMGDKDTDFITSMIKFQPDLKWMSPKEIMEKYPTLENIPDNYIGNISHDAGIVQVKNALKSFKIMAQEHGATLLYEAEVGSATKDSVTLKDGRVFHADHVVISCGKYTIERFDKQSKAKYIETETITFGGDLSGLPDLMSEKNDENPMYGLRDNSELSEFKVSVFAERNLDRAFKFFRERLPSKIKDIRYSMVCYYTMTGSDNFIYKTNPDGVHYCYGFNGQGFKFMPIHGKIVYDGLISKKDTTYLVQTRAKL